MKFVGDKKTKPEEAPVTKIVCFISYCFVFLLAFCKCNVQTYLQNASTFKMYFLC